MPEFIHRQVTTGTRPLEDGANMAGEDAGQAALRRARHNRDRLRSKSREVHRLLVALGELFGEPMRAVLEHPVEAVTEHGDEAAEAYEAALRDAQAKTDEVRRLFTIAIDEQKRVRDVAHRAQTELIRRHRKARRDLPAWLLDDLARTNHPDAEEPF